MKLKKNRILIGILNVVLCILVFSNFFLSGLASDATNSTASNPNPREGRLDIYGLFVHIATYFWFYLFIFGLSLLLIIVLVLWRLSKLKEYPIIYVTGEDSEDEKLGRIIESVQDKYMSTFYLLRFKKTATEEDYMKQAQEDSGDTLTQKYFKTELQNPKNDADTKKDETKEEKKKKKKARKRTFRTKKEKDYMTCRCLQHFAEMQQFRWKRENWGVTIRDFYPAYHKYVRPLPPTLWFKKKELKNTVRNKFYYGLFLLTFKSRFVHKHLEYVETDEFVKEIILLIHQLQVERKQFLFRTTYERKEIIQGIPAWVEYPDVKLMSIEDPDQEGKQYFLEDVRPQNRDMSRPMKESFLLIFMELKERKMELDKLIKHGVLKEEERHLFMSLAQIDAFSKNPNHRNVQRHGDPITKMTQNKNLREAVANQEHESELQANYAIATAEKDARIRDLEKENHEIRDALIQLDLKIPSIVDNEVLKFIHMRKQNQGTRLDLVARALNYDDLGYEERDSIIASLKDEKTSSEDKEIIQRLLKGIKIRDALIDRLAPKNQNEINISIPKQNAGTTLHGKGDLYKFRDELKNRGDGGHDTDQ